MKVSYLIKLLQEVDPDALVLAYDYEADGMEEVMSIVISSNNKFVELHTEYDDYDEDDNS